MKIPDIFYIVYSWEFWVTVAAIIIFIYCVFNVGFATYDFCEDCCEYCNCSGV